VEQLTARYAISVTTRDRVGIIADVSEALYELGGNLEALSQTVVWGWFTMIVCGAFPEGTTPERIKQALESAGDFIATVLPSTEPSMPRPTAGEPFVVTVVGGDKPGIVRRLTRCFARKDINIEDVWDEVRDGQIVVIFHLTVPPAVEREDLRRDLDQVGGELGLSVMLQHQDIFTATNSLSMPSRR